MKIAFFDTHSFEQVAFEHANVIAQHEIQFLEVRLTKDTAVLASGSKAICAFIEDRLDSECLTLLRNFGVELVALRSAGYNQVDLKAAGELCMTVVRVPEYSPYAVAEYALGLMLTLNRKYHRSFSRVRELNFSLNGLLGFDMYRKTVGIVGTGRIGSVLAHILKGFGCNILAFDLNPSDELRRSAGVQYVPFEELLKRSDIISLHVPLSAESRYIVDEKALALMKKGVMLINTSRGGLVDTRALISSLKNGHIGSAGLDVYEEEGGVFFEDHSRDLLQDDVLARLLTFPNVFVSSHQGFLTTEALANIARTTLENVSDFAGGVSLKNQVSHER